MASKWFYRVDGREHGPVSSNEIRELAISGRLRPTDQIRKDGSDDWRVAGESAKLFPGGASNIREAVTELATDLTAGDAKAVLAAAATTTGKAAQATGLELRRFAATATTAAALTAERLKITTLSLDDAFTKLGKHCYEDGTCRPLFPDLFAAIDVLFEPSVEHSPSSNSTSPPDAPSPKPGRGIRKDDINWKQALAFEDLGKAFYEQTPAPTDPAELLTPIRSLYSRLSEIDASLATHKAALTSNGKGIPPIVVGLAIVFLLPVGLYLLWTHPTLGSNRKWWAAASAYLVFVLFIGRPAGNANERLSTGQAASGTNTGGSKRSDSKERTPPNTTTPSSSSSTDAISAVVFWNTARNEAQVRKQYPGSVTLRGEVLDVKKDPDDNKWHVRLTTHEGPRGVDGWIECVMTNGSGLDTLSQGDIVLIMGSYDKGTGPWIYMKKCTLKASR